MVNAVQIDTIRLWHEQVVDWMLENPHLTQGQCADHFDKTQSWLSTLINSDLFQEYKDRRFRQHQELVSHSVIERVSGLASLSLEVLHDRILEEKDDIPLGIVKDSAELTLKALGFGPKPSARAPTTVVTLNVGGASAEVLAEARGNLRRIHEENTTPEPDIEEAEVVDGSPDTPQLPLFGEV